MCGGIWITELQGSKGHYEQSLKFWDVFSAWRYFWSHHIHLDIPVRLSSAHLISSKKKVVLPCEGLQEHKNTALSTVNKHNRETASSFTSHKTECTSVGPEKLHNICQQFVLLICRLKSACSQFIDVETAVCEVRLESSAYFDVIDQFDLTEKEDLRVCGIFLSDISLVSIGHLNEIELLMGGFWEPHPSVDEVGCSFFRCEDVISSFIVSLCEKRK